MAFLVFSKHCKWKTRPSNVILGSHGSTCFSRSFSYSLPAARDEENKVVEKVKVMVKSTKYGSFRSMESLWKSFFAAPYNWYDYRMNKKNRDAPDFKHIETGQVLWIRSHKTPACAESKLSSLGRGAFAASQSLEQLWKSFFSDPSKWFDHRKIKKSNRHPDFVHKYTRESLWTEGKHVPNWVAPTLKSLQAESFETSAIRINLWRSLFADPSKWFDNRKNKKVITHPDFVHKDTCEALWIENKRDPTWVAFMLSNIRDEEFALFPSLENLWKALFANPSNWLDFRKNKRNREFPDFKHEKSGESLWIDSKGTPSWVLLKLNGLQVEEFASSSSLEDLWISFFLDQSKWIDYRITKKISSHPDFMRKDTSEALWIEDSETPAWTTVMLNNLQTKSFAPSLSIEELWKVLFDDPSKWFDNRNTKKSNKYPDFKHKITREALWIDCRSTPAWVLLKLKNLQYEVFACQDEMLASYEVKWKDFFANPSNWFDNRTRKINPHTPDFRHKKTSDALWIVSHLTPDWVVLSLKNLENEAVAPSVVKNLK